MNKPNNITLTETINFSIRGYKLWWDANPKLLLSSALCAIVDALTPYVGIFLLALLLDEIAGSRDPHTLNRIVIASLISAAVLSLLSAVLSRWKNCHYHTLWHIEQKIYTTKLLSLDFKSVDDTHTHDLLSQIRQNRQWNLGGLDKLLYCFDRLIKSLMTIAGAIALTVPMFIRQVPDSAGRLTILNNPIVNILIIVVMFAVTYIAPALYTKAGSFYVTVSEMVKLSNQYLGYFWSRGFEYHKALDIRTYRQDIFCKDMLDEVLSDTSFFAGPKKYILGVIGKFNACAGATSQIFTGIVYIYVCLKAWGGAFGVGAVTQYIGAITALSGGMSSFISTIGELRNNTAFLHTTFEFLDIPNDMYQGSLTIVDRSDKKHEIEFRNVSFKYPGTDSHALRNLSLKFKIGKRLAIVGMNGSGKTTFIKLLCRLYDPTEGDILLNGIEIWKYDYGEYMSIFSVVFQDFQLLSFGLGQSVAASKEYDRQKVDQCLTDAGLRERLDKMPQGLDTCLYREFDRKGVEISGGEAQKIALARALYKEAAFIVLDEPTAALDPVAEFEVYSKMNEIVGNKTAVFISHRLSSCRFCDDIAVFHEGRIIQRGSHDDLVIDDRGKYFELWNAQAQYYSRSS